MKNISGRLIIAPQEEMSKLVEACNQDSDLTVQTAQAMAQRMADEELEPFAVVQILRVVNPQHDKGDA